MNIPGGAYNGAMFSHMALGGYLAYIASDELSPNWLGRLAVDPGMDLPQKNLTMHLPFTRFTD